MSNPAFDEYAEKYDAWFLENRAILESEVLLLRRFLHNPGDTLSVGCGTGLFELILREEHGINIRFGVEPSDDMRGVAVKRGLLVESGSAEALPYLDGNFDTVLLNGIPGYVDDLETAFASSPTFRQRARSGSCTRSRQRRDRGTTPRCRASLPPCRTRLNWRRRHAGARPGKRPNFWNGSASPASSTRRR